jgi:hypothetical protein
MKILVCGGRNFLNEPFIFDTLDDVAKRGMEMLNPVRLVIHGDARGADQLAHGWATVRGIQPVLVPALWHVHGRAAGAIRNQNMLLLHPDLVVVFPGGPGTAHMAKIADKVGIQVLRFSFDNRAISA